MAKEASVIVLDVGRSMGDLRGSTTCGLEKAKKAIRRLIQEKLLFPNRDEMGLVLVGTVSTANELHEEAGGYENITVIREMEPVDLECLELMDSIECQDAQADIIDGLLVAMSMINTRVRHLKFAKRIFIFTDAAGTIIDDPEQTEIICNNLVEEDYKINVVGIDFQEDDFSDSESEKKELPKVAIIRTKTQLKNEEFLRDFSERVNGGLFTGNNALRMLDRPYRSKVKSMTKYRGTFEIGNSNKIQVWTYAKVAIARFPTLKRLSKVSMESNEPDTMEVITDTTYWNKTTDEDIEVKKSDRIKSFKYGNQEIPFIAEEVEMCKYKCIKSMKVLGFTKKELVPRHEFMSTVDIIIASPKDAKSKKALSALIHALFELNMVACVRYVKRKNAQPLFGICSPSIDATMECLYFNQMPFEEDVRNFSFPLFSDKHHCIPSSEQRNAARKLICSMDLMKSNVDDEFDEKLKPDNTYDPILQRFYHCVTRRALDPSASISDLDPSLDNHMYPDKKLLAQAESTFNEFSNVFSFKKIEKIDLKSKKRHWRDFYDLPPDCDEDIKIAKQVKKEPTLDSHIQNKSVDLKFDDIVAKKVMKVGTVDPINDFKMMINRRICGSDVDVAITQMIDIIKDIVKHAFGGDTYPKALDCLNELRKGCVIHEECDIFNKTLQDYKTMYKKKLPAFWKLIVEKKIYPIDNTEVLHSIFTQEQAQKFLDKEEIVSITPLPKPMDDIDEEDLWQSLE